MSLCLSASAYFVETKLSSGAGVQANFSTLSTVTQAGTNTIVYVTSTLNDTSGVTLLYLDSSRNQRYVTLTLNGTQNVSSAGTASDIAYVVRASLNASAVGNISIKGTNNVTIYTINTGNFTPIDNYASHMCYSATGCTLRNIFYGSDYFMKVTFNIWGINGENRTALTLFNAAGAGQQGSGVVKYKAGERMWISATPYSNNTNMSIYYEVG